MHSLVGESFPQVYHIAHVCHRHRTLLVDALSYGWYQFVEVVVQLVYPSLVVAFLGCQRIYLCHHAHHTGYVACLGLCARHAAQSRRYKQHSADVVCRAFGAELLTTGVQHGYGSAVHDALRTDVHV